MKQRILRIVSSIKDNLKQIDDEGVYHPLHDEIYDQLSLIEDEIYDEEMDMNLGFDEDEE